jgi:hypothetical protein
MRIFAWWSSQFLQVFSNEYLVIIIIIIIIIIIHL